MFELCACGHGFGAHDGGEDGDGYECSLCKCQGFHFGGLDPAGPDDGDGG